MGFDSLTFANKDAYLQNVGLFSYRILSNPHCNSTVPCFLERSSVIRSCVTLGLGTFETEGMVIPCLVLVSCFYRSTVAEIIFISSELKVGCKIF